MRARIFAVGSCSQGDRTVQGRAGKRLLQRIFGRFPFRVHGSGRDRFRGSHALCQVCHFRLQWRPERFFPWRRSPETRSCPKDVRVIDAAVCPRTIFHARFRGRGKKTYEYALWHEREFLSAPSAGDSSGRVGPRGFSPAWRRRRRCSWANMISRPSRMWARKINSTVAGTVCRNSTGVPALTDLESVLAFSRPTAFSKQMVPQHDGFAWWPAGAGRLDAEGRGGPLLDFRRPATAGPRPTAPRPAGLTPGPRRVRTDFSYLMPTVPVCGERPQYRVEASALPGETGVPFFSEFGRWTPGWIKPVGP